jgi:GNAT superfamily N-acetyltransferase
VSLAEDVAIAMRGALPEDAPALREIYLAARAIAFHWLDNSANRLEDFDRDTEGEEIMVALRGGEIAGFISLWLPDNFVHQLFMHPAHSGQGVGKALLAEGLKRIGRPATLKCLSMNVRAVKFYANNGWQVREADTGPDGPYYLFELAELD